MLDSLFNKVIEFQACNFIKKRFQQRCFPVGILKHLRTPILKNICQRLLLALPKMKNTKKLWFDAIICYVSCSLLIYTDVLKPTFAAKSPLNKSLTNRETHPFCLSNVFLSCRLLLLNLMRFL